MSQNVQEAQKENILSKGGGQESWPLKEREKLLWKVRANTKIAISEKTLVNVFEMVEEHFEL